MKTRVLNACAMLLIPVASFAAEYNLSVDNVTIDTGDFIKQGVGFNGASPGPVLRLKEGETVTLNVTNNLDKNTSIHWHGLILPAGQDGVPGISFPGIKPGETFSYQFPLVQNGTYWYHSHSGFQEPDGAYGAIVIESATREPYRYDRDYVVQLTDKHPDNGQRIMRNLKSMPDYYNRQQPTVSDFFDDVANKGFMSALKDKLTWGDMRMMKVDIEDVQGFTGLINGKGPKQNWTGLFKKGERVRLRFINSSAMTYFDVRIPGLKMTLVQADGNNVQPVAIDEFRISVAETYDVIVQPEEDKAYSIFAESMGRTGFASGTLAPREGMQAEIPKLRPAPKLTMADMSGMDMSGMDMSGIEGMDHSKMDMGGMDMSAMDHSEMPMDTPEMDAMDHSKMDMGSMTQNADPFYAKGSGLTPTAANGGKFLSYADLKAQKPLYEDREATREIELRLTGNMERYTWSINGIKYEDAEPIRLQYGERVRFKFVNETMMTHPMHLHGMWSMLDVGEDQWNPIKHVISVQPGTTVYTETEVDAPGQWAFHCHLTYHADAGMFRKVIVEGGPATTAGNTSNSLGDDA